MNRPPIILTAIFMMLFGCVVQAEPSGDRFSSFYGFSLGETTLYGVQKKIGATAISHSGDAGENISSICYAVNSSSYVLFFSGELDGPEHYLGGFGISNRSIHAPCSSWPKNAPEPSLNIGGLYIGMSVSAFKTIIGIPVRWEVNQGIALFESKKKMSAAELEKLPIETQTRIARGESRNYYDVEITVSAIFESDRLCEVRIWKTETL